MNEIQNSQIAADINWDVIIDGIESDDTIICIGSEIFNSLDKKLDELLEDALRNAKVINFTAYQDGLFHFKGSADTMAHSIFKRFYNQQFIELQSMLDKIAQIKCKMIISLIPSLHLKQSFERQNFQHDYAIYFKKKESPIVSAPKKEHPLIYNFLGEITKRESLVLTHDDLYDFLESVVEHKSMPELLRENIRDARNLIFIGLPFEKWYMQLLLRVLRQHTNKLALKYAANYDFDEKVSTFCHDHYNITCVPFKIRAFIDELHDQCKKADLLRSTNQNIKIKPYWEIEKLMEEGNLKTALEKMRDYIKVKCPTDNANLGIIIQLLGRLKNLNDEMLEDLISSAEAKHEKAKIRQLVLDIHLSLKKCLS
jgi:SIR2-like domain/Effector-associated domain 11